MVGSNCAPPGAVGVNIFRRTAEDAPPAQPKGGGKKKRQRSALPRGQSCLGLAAPTQLDSQAEAGEREAGKTAAASGEKVDNEGEAK